jgi:hypothetical protein
MTLKQRDLQTRTPQYLRFAASEVMLPAAT